MLYFDIQGAIYFVDARSLLWGFVSLFQDHLIALIPVMRAYALFLTGKQADADDLVQQSLEKAWRAQDRYVDGTNLKAWVLTIVRNSHHNNWRQGRRIVEDPDGRAAGRMSREEDQLWSAQVRDVVAAIGTLDDDQRHALLLIIAGLSYEEAAIACATPLRTVQSRVRRARARLASILCDI